MMAMLVDKKILVPTAGKLLFLLTNMGAMKSTARQQKSARNTVVSKTKTEARSTQISKNEAAYLENEDP